jgi:hypothetical protein
MSVTWQSDVTGQDSEVGGVSAEAGATGHLIDLPGGQWSLWRCVCLRSAGFPAVQVLRLAPPEAREAAEAALCAEDEEAGAHRRALAAINARLDGLRRSGEWESKERRAPLISALRALTAGKLPAALEGEPEINADVEALGVARARWQQAQEDFRAAYRTSLTRVSAAACELLQDERFSEAMIWQNRQAYRLVTRALLRGAAQDGARNSKLRQSEDLVATYLQRYCVKNDSIGFFGPIGWASLRPERDDAVAVRPGPGLLASRTVYFEGWGIDVLAETLAAEGGRRRWAAPRRVPYVRLEGNAVHLPLSSRPIMLPARQAAVLRACDRRRTAHEIAAQLTADPASGFKGEEEVYETLDKLKERGFIAWTFEVPLAPRPEAQLRKLLERVEPDDLRESALDALDEVEGARRRVALAAGDAPRLDEALGALEEMFTRLTSESATRAEGQTYAARTLVYEDGRRDVEVEIGGSLLDELAPPLTLMLASARWLSAELAQTYRRVFEETYAELSRQMKSDTVDAISFWLTVQPALFDESRPRPVDPLETLFQERWAQVLSLPREGRRLSYTSAELLPRVREAFPATRPGWRQARHHSPDVMIAADSAEAIRRGDYQLVLGEMHLATNTLSAALFVAQHPTPEDLHDFVAADHGEPLLTTVTPKSWPNQTLRTLPLLIPRGDCYIEAAYDAIAPDGCEALPITELVIERRGGGLVARTRDGRRSFDIVDTFGEALSRIAVNTLRVMSRAAHTPRVTIDRMVVCREGWNFPAAELEFAYANDEAERFLGVRRWARAHDIPRFSFVKVPVEVKPIYVDFGSPIYVDLFTKLIRRTIEGGAPGGLVSLSEMLPGAEQAWLADAAGRKYTSELRFVAFDRSAKLT